MTITAAVFGAAVVTAAQLPFGLDTTFRSDILFRNANSVAVMDDGRLLVSGRLNFFLIPGEWPLARLNSEGSRDLSYTFNTPGGGKIVPWGGGYYVGTGLVQRLDAAGYLDPTFIQMNDGPYFLSGQGGDYYVYPDGRVLISGLHTLSDTVRGFLGDHSLVWFSNTGYLDTTRIHRKANNAIYAIKEQPDGKFVCSGLCTIYESQPVPRMFRVMPDGALDPTFQTDFVWGQARALSVLADGRVIASGALLRNGQTDTLQLVRLMPDGSLDPTFNNALDAPNESYGAFGTIVGHTILPDGRIALHGNFHEVDGEPRSGIALLDQDGYLLGSAFAGNGCGTYNDGFNDIHSTHGMVEAQDGSWYMYGTYIGYDDGTTNDPEQRFVSRLYGLDVGVGERAVPLGGIEVYPNPGSTWVAFNVNLQGSANGAMLIVRDITGRAVWRDRVANGQCQLLWDCRTASAGSYCVELTNAGTLIAAEKLIVQP